MFVLSSNCYIKQFDVAHNQMGVNLTMFVLVEELDPTTYPEEFHFVEVKEEPIEYKAVSCDMFYHIYLMLIFIYFHHILILNKTKEQ